MTTRLKDPLLLAGKAIAIFMQAAMVFGVVALSAAFVGVVFFAPELAAEAGLDPFPPDFPVAALAAIVLIGLAIVTMMFFFFDRLRRIKGILLAIVLFILARVFRHGAAMREDLEGTV